MYCLKNFLILLEQAKGYFPWKTSQQSQTQTELLRTLRVFVYIFITTHKTLHRSYLFAYLSPLSIPLKKIPTRL